jgi:hypothetical protein
MLLSLVPAEAVFYLPRSYRHILLYPPGPTEPSNGKIPMLDLVATRLQKFAIFGTALASNLKSLLS